MSDPISPIVSHPLIISIASAIVLCDIPFLLLIFVNRHLRKQKELIIVGFVCIADTAHALGTLLAGVLRLWLFLNDRLSTTITNQDCTKYGFPVIFLFSYQLMGSATLVVAFDRFIAVTKPVHYRALDERFTFGVMGALVLYVTITSATFLLFIHLSPPLQCSSNCFTSESYLPWIWKYLLYFRMSALILSSLLYLPISFKIYKMSKALKNRTTDKIYLQKIIRTTRTVGFTVATELIFVVMTDSFLTFNPFGLARYQVIWYTCALSKGALNVLLITLQHDEVLNVLRAKFKRTREGAKIASSVIPSTASRSSKGHGYVGGS